MTPNYDDGGSIDSFSPETIYLDECGECIYDMQITEESFRSTPTDPTIDELPF
jgi:hypothetical protein